MSILLLIGALFVLIRARSTNQLAASPPVTEVAGDIVEQPNFSAAELPAVTLATDIVHEGWETLGDSDDIYDVALSQDAVWVATGSGVVRWTTDGEFEKVGSEHGLASGRARTIAIAADGTVWVGTLGGGISALTAGEWTTWGIADGLPSADIYDIEITADGNIWAATGNGVVEITNGSVNAIAVGMDLNNQLISDILLRRDGTLWAISQLGVFRRDVGSSFVPIAGESIFTNSLPSAIGLDVDEQLWVGTLTGELFTLLGDTWAPDAFSAIDTEKINAIMPDANGVLWVATDDGVYSQTETDWEKITSGTLPSEATRAIASADGSGLWFGTRQGLVSRVGPQFRTYVTEDGLESNFIQDLIISADDEVWVGTLDGGIATLDADDTWQSITAEDNLTTNDIWSMTFGPDDELWLGTQGNGVMVLADDDVTTYTAADGLANNTINVVMSGPSQTPWIGTAQNGLYSFDDEFITQDYDGRGNVFDLDFDDTNTLRTAVFDGDLLRTVNTGTVWRPIVAENALPSEKALSVFATENNNLWLGTAGGGVLYFDGLDWTIFTDADGLANNVIWDITADADENIWLATGNGISVYNGVSWQSYTTADGLAGNEVRALKFDSEGTLWAATSGGVSRISTDAINP